jgi:hypothetical protein
MAQAMQDGFERMNARLVQMESTLATMMRWTEDLDARLAKACAHGHTHAHTQ